MKLAVIDIGSNSVRLLYNSKKTAKVTILSQGLFLTHNLDKVARERTLKVVVDFRDLALQQGAEKVLVFATEAVRSANNGNDFIIEAKKYDIDIDLLSREREATLGFSGAYDYGTVAVLDIGGASAELAVGDSNGLKYHYSLPLGAVRLSEYDPNSIQRLMQYIKPKLNDYGEVPQFDRLISIGGTSSSIVAIKLQLKIYDPQMIHKQILTKSDIWDTINKIYATPIEDRDKIVGLNPDKKMVIAPGGTLLYMILNYLNIDNCMVSEKDNLEGYLAIANKTYN